MSGSHDEQLNRRRAWARDLWERMGHESISIGGIDGMQQRLYKKFGGGLSVPDMERIQREVRQQQESAAAAGASTPRPTKGLSVPLRQVAASHGLTQPEPPQAVTIAPSVTTDIKYSNRLEAHERDIKKHRDDTLDAARKAAIIEQVRLHPGLKLWHLHGVGRDEVKRLVDELVQDGRVTTKPGYRKGSVILFLPSDVTPAPEPARQERKVNELPRWHVPDPEPTPPADARARVRDDLRAGRITPAQAASLLDLLGT